MHKLLDIIKNNLKKYNITKEKKKLFNNNKLFFIQEEILYDFTYFIVNRNATFTERSLYYDVLTFIFYGLYFELFTKEELTPSEKTLNIIRQIAYTYRAMKINGKLETYFLN